MKIYHENLSLVKTGQKYWGLLMKTYEHVIDAGEINLLYKQSLQVKWSCIHQLTAYYI